MSRFSPRGSRSSRRTSCTYTVQLRKGIEFNDGTPFNAQAVVTTSSASMTYPGSFLASDYAIVDSVTATGPYTVVFHLKQRDSAFLSGDRNYVSLADGDREGRRGLLRRPDLRRARSCSTIAIVGDNITLIKSPYYYDRKDVFLDKIVFKPITDAAAAEAALEAGDIQAIDNVSPTTLDSVRENSSLRVIQAPQLGWGGVVINIGNRNGVQQPAVPERRHAARAEPAAAAGVRGGDRPPDAEQGGLRRPLPAELHGDTAGQHSLVRA